MKYYDITKPLSSETIPWPGDTRFSMESKQTSAIVSKLTLSTHTGTHIDAPKHFIFDKIGVDKLPLTAFVGKFKVFDVKTKNLIEPKDLPLSKIKAGDRIILKTSNTAKLTKKTEFTDAYVSLSLEAAEILAKKKISLIGIDYFGIEAKAAPGHPVHKALLARNIVIVEGLLLTQVKAGEYNGAILPLKIVDGDGSPCRAILWK
ncbi:MAG TPA: cyclase family protein [Patescibacteria group bacterium]|nr:cyclase family protein [Patescibacteria group bacterium]